MKLQISLEIFVSKTIHCITDFKEIFNIIKEINESGTTVLLVEQNANMALSIADKAYVLETGRIALAGTAQELASSEAVRKAYLGG